MGFIIFTAQMGWVMGEHNAVVIFLDVFSLLVLFFLLSFSFPLSSHFPLIFSPFPFGGFPILFFNSLSSPSCIYAWFLRPPRRPPTTIAAWKKPHAIGTGLIAITYSLPLGHRYIFFSSYMAIAWLTNII